MGFELFFCFSFDRSMASAVEKKPMPFPIGSLSIVLFSPSLTLSLNLLTIASSTTTKEPIPPSTRFLSASDAAGPDPKTATLVRPSASWPCGPQTRSWRS